MRRKFLLTIGLAVLGACLTAGTAGAGNVVGVGESGVEIQLPDGQNLDEIEVLPQCSNLADDDGDAVTDLEDPDCSGPLDSTESGSTGPAEPQTPPDQTTPTQPTDEDDGSADEDEDTDTKPERRRRPGGARRSRDRAQAERRAQARKPPAQRGRG